MSVELVQDTVTTELVRETLADTLLRARSEAGLSVRDVSAHLNQELSAAAVSRIERGERSPNTETLVRLARAYGIRFIVDGDGIRQQL